MIAGVVLALLFAFSIGASARSPSSLSRNQRNGAQPVQRAMAHAGPGGHATAGRAEAARRCEESERARRAGVGRFTRRTALDRTPGRLGLAGERIEFPGLQLTITDVLVRFEMLDGQGTTIAAARRSRGWKSAAAHRSSSVAGTYLRLGIEHIWGGIDHLLFVLALMILVKGWRRLVAHITAFTVAHSITLAAATLGFVHVPSAAGRGQHRAEHRVCGGGDRSWTAGRPGLTERWPWVIAFTFGLLHGFGFAGALSAVGLPQNAIPVALLFFNLGVEAGQLLFIACRVFGR